MKRALITGGAGFIGSSIAMQLSSSGIEVLVLDNLSFG
jgi:dTDP-L-rhamnose 4-epimerase